MEENETLELHDFNYEGLIFKTTYTKKFAERKPYEPYNPKKLTAFIPGTILKVYVKEREKVKKGDKLLVLQAMKMNNIILAPLDGSIKKVYVKQGEVVEKNHLLVEMR
ncbi:MAG TPA: acetyl-CoA carboxylase biotin carboxyl carrier protein subunit [Bacteroidales bacterium]|nr:acetyl-CoA carboxylase biotin carboxyl carrier protein subunit [Bacteroidales bacterium]